MSSERSFQLRQMLHDEFQEQEQLKATDQIFFLAFKNCQLIINLLTLYTFSITLASFLLMFPFQAKPLDFMLTYICAVSLLRFYHYQSIRMALQERNHYYKIAQITQHLAHVLAHQLPEEVRGRNPLYLDSQDFRDPQNQDIQRKLRSLSYEIKVTSINLDSLRKKINKIQFILYQMSHFMSILFLLYQDFGEQSTAKVLMIIMVVIGTYQYIQFYLLTVFLAIVLPYYFLRHIWNNLVQRYRNYKLEKSLKSERFSQKNVVGDHQCKICLQSYQPNDKIIVLQCNQMHNFHANCLREWARQSGTCPLCRADLTSF